MSRDKTPLPQPDIENLGWDYNHIATLYRDRTYINNSATPLLCNNNSVILSVLDVYPERIFTQLRNFFSIFQENYIYRRTLQDANRSFYDFLCQIKNNFLNEKKTNSELFQLLISNNNVKADDLIGLIQKILWKFFQDKVRDEILPILQPLRQMLLQKQHLTFQDFLKKEGIRKKIDQAELGDRFIIPYRYGPHYQSIIMIKVGDGKFDFDILNSSSASSCRVGENTFCEFYSLCCGLAGSADKLGKARVIIINKQAYNNSCGPVSVLNSKEYLENVYEGKSDILTLKVDNVVYEGNKPPEIGFLVDEVPKNWKHISGDKVSVQEQNRDDALNKELWDLVQKANAVETNSQAGIDFQDLYNNYGKATNYIKNEDLTVLNNCFKKTDYKKSSPIEDNFKKAVTDWNKYDQAKPETHKPNLYCGVGLSIKVDAGGLRVISDGIYPSGPNCLVGKLITGVRNGWATKTITDSSVAEVINAIRGFPPGSEVHLIIEGMDSMNPAQTRTRQIITTENNKIAKLESFSKVPEPQNAQKASVSSSHDTGGTRKN